MSAEETCCYLVISEMIKLLVAVYCNSEFHVAEAKIIRHKNSGQFSKQRQNFPYWNEKSKSQTQVLSSSFPFLCLQLLKISLLRLRVAVVGEKMMRNCTYLVIGICICWKDCAGLNTHFYPVG